MSAARQSGSGAAEAAGVGTDRSCGWPRRLCAPGAAAAVRSWHAEPPPQHRPRRRRCRNIWQPAVPLRRRPTVRDGPRLSEALVQCHLASSANYVLTELNTANLELEQHLKHADLSFRTMAHFARAISLAHICCSFVGYT